MIEDKYPGALEMSDFFDSWYTGVITETVIYWCIFCIQTGILQ